MLFSLTTDQKLMTTFPHCYTIFVSYINFFRICKYEFVFLSKHRCVACTLSKSLSFSNIKLQMACNMAQNNQSSLNRPHRDSLSLQADVLRENCLNASAFYSKISECTVVPWQHLHYVRTKHVGSVINHMRTMLSYSNSLWAILMCVSSDVFAAIASTNTEVFLHRNGW
jgi:hypothetical protein